jgi:hypothetical protein
MLCHNCIKEYGLIRAGWQAYSQCPGCENCADLYETKESVDCERCQDRGIVGKDPKDKHAVILCGCKAGQAIKNTI